MSEAGPSGRHDQQQQKTKHTTKNPDAFGVGVQG